MAIDDSNELSILECRIQSDKQLEKKVALAYDGYKGYLKQRMHYDAFVELVDKNIDEVQKGDYTEKVANKIKEWADRKIRKEKKMDPITKFFHKIGQFIQGHGFRTTGKYGKRLGEKITLATQKDVKKKYPFTG